MTQLNTLEIPDDLYIQIQGLALSESRSVNEQIVSTGKIMRIIVHSLSILVFQIFNELAILMMVTLIDKHGSKL